MYFITPTIATLTMFLIPLYYMHRRIAYQDCSNSFAVAACRIDVATQDDPRTFKPLRQRYVILQAVELALLAPTPFIRKWSSAYSQMHVIVYMRL